MFCRFIMFRGVFFFFFFFFLSDWSHYSDQFYPETFGTWVSFVGKMYPSDHTFPDLDCSVGELPVCHGQPCRLLTKDRVPKNWIWAFCRKTAGLLLCMWFCDVIWFIWDGDKYHKCTSVSFFFLLFFSSRFKKNLKAFYFVHPTFRSKVTCSCR